MMRDGKTASEVDYMGKKLKTFVSAKGVTLAEQSLVTISGTTSEKLSFIHQDASGASVQQTNSSGTLTQTGTRAGEYDALGRNVADASPFITLNSEPPPSESGSSGIDLDGTSAGYRAGRQIYRIDGQVVSQTQFMETVNSGLIGGAFGLLEIQTRMSAQPPRQIGYWRRTETWSKITGDSINFHTQESNLGNVYADNNWWGIGNLISTVQQPTQDDIVYGKPFKVSRELMSVVANVVNGFLDKNPKCEKFVNSLLNQLSKDTGLKLEGDIRYFINEFAKTGNLTLTAVSSRGGGNVSPGGQSDPGITYGSPKWGFSQDLTNKWFDRTIEANVSTFLHELIHTIGNRNEGSFFGDRKAANAVHNMGLMKMSPDEYYKLPENAEKLEEYIKNGWSTNAIPSNYWKGTLDYHCGKNKIPSYLMKK